jgi:hypothetical protein
MSLTLLRVPSLGKTSVAIEWYPRAISCWENYENNVYYNDCTMGVDAPSAQNTFYNMYKNLWKNFFMYIWTFYVHSQSFARKRHFLACVKKTIVGAMKLIFMWHSFVCLHSPQEMPFLHSTLWVNIEFLDVHLQVFLFKYFYILQRIFHNRFIWTYEPKHHTMCVIIVWNTSCEFSINHFCTSMIG